MSSRIKFLVAVMFFTAGLRTIPYVLTAYNVTVNPDTLYYPWNFVPMMALCLFAGAYVTDRRFAIGLPMLALLLSDLGIWGVTGQFSWAFPPDRWSAYLSHGFAVLLGQGLDRRTWPLRAVDAVGRGILAEVIFFVVTNFAYFMVQTDLPHNMMGLAACYVAAIPFAIRSFVSTAVFSALLFSPIGLAAADQAEAQKSELNSAIAP